MGEPVAQVDIAALVGEFLAELSFYDILIELVQNELDAGSTKTEIEIADDALICTGDGHAIDPEGWERLLFVLGAGSLVRPKEDGIGSKNHGLRSGFLLGDDIIVQSDNHRIELTARGRRADPAAFYPAALPKMADNLAPLTGVRVTIPYREQPLIVPGRNPHLPPSPEILDELFHQAVELSPDRFLCASTPGEPWSYELVFKRGETQVRFRYLAKRFKGSRLHMRTCTAVEGASRRVTARRLCSPFQFEPDEKDTAKVPQLFRKRGRILGELSWLCDAKGRPLRGRGAYRYPIALPLEHVQTGWGFDISGPYVAGRVRHTLDEDPRNAAVTESGVEAFISLMRNTLVPAFGPDALELARDSTVTNRERTGKLVTKLFAAGALPLAGGSSRKSTVRRFELLKPGSHLYLPILTFEADRLSHPLAALTSVVGSTLHPSTPKALLEMFRELQRVEPCLNIYSEADAARAVFIEAAPAEGEIDPNWLTNCLSVVKLLDLARLHDTLDPELMRKLKDVGRLPAECGAATAWSRLRRSKEKPPAVPGVQAPMILHRALNHASVLREGAGRVELFKLDPHLSHLDFTRTGGAARLAFFKWLRRGHAFLQPRTLAKIASYPVWPGIDNQCRPLDDYCLPRASYLRDALFSVQAAPAKEVIHFPGLRSASNAALRLRRTPKVEELSAWHVHWTEKVDDALSQELGIDALVLVDSMETVMDRMRCDDLSPSLYANNHRTVSRAGTIRVISELHVETAAVAACALLDEDIVVSGRKALHSALGAQQAPRPEAIVRALRSAPDPSRLTSRLAAYRKTGRELSDLSGERIILLGTDLCEPKTLAFPSTTDFWGDWKRKLPFADRTPEEVHLLVAAGIIKATVREEHSREFFRWVADQPSAIQLRHLPQIIRHWLDGRGGPGHWASSVPHSPCIPARNREGQIALLSLRDAIGTRPKVFLPDFPDIQEQVLKDNQQLRLAVTHHRDVDGSILHPLKNVGVRSLKTEAGLACALTIEGESASDNSLLAELTLLQSPMIRRTLPKLLPQHDVPAEALVHSWRRLVKEVKGTRIAPKIHANYGVLRKNYTAATNGGFDELTKLVCVSADANPILAFYDAMTSFLFVPGSPAAYAHGLYYAIHDPSQRNLFHYLRAGVDEDDEDQKALANGISGGENPTPNKGHGLPSDINPFAPKPKKLENLTTLTFPAGGHKSRKPRRPAKTDSKRHSLEEDAQIQALKNDHYALHCQACLGQLDVLEATPPNSYVYSPHYRRGFIDAHHVVHLQNEVGGQGAANLLVLCRYHHHMLGDLFTREIIKEALRRAKPVTRNFPSGNSEQLEARRGLCATLSLPTEPRCISLFFTPEHARIWIA